MKVQGRYLHSLPTPAADRWYTFDASDDTQLGDLYWDSKSAQHVVVMALDSSYDGPTRPLHPLKVGV